jgi:hypothetical protein
MFLPRLIDLRPIDIRSGHFVSRIVQSHASEAGPTMEDAKKHATLAANSWFSLKQP